MQFHFCVYACVCANVCGDQNAVWDAVAQASSTFLFETEFLTGLELAE